MPQTCKSCLLQGLFTLFCQKPLADRPAYHRRCGLAENPNARFLLDFEPYSTINGVALSLPALIHLMIVQAVPGASTKHQTAAAVCSCATPLRNPALRSSESLLAWCSCSCFSWSRAAGMSIKLTWPFIRNLQEKDEGPCRRNERLLTEAFKLWQSMWLKQNERQAHQEAKDAGKHHADAIVLRSSPIHQVLLVEKQPKLVPEVLRVGLFEEKRLAALLRDLVALNQTLRPPAQHCHTQALHSTVCQ